MTEERDERDQANWDAVEEASELLQEERWTEALLNLREVIKANPKNPYAFYFLGSALYESKAIETSRDAYLAALRLSPDYIGARVSLSHVLRELGDLEGALKHAKLALARFPKHADALQAVGLAEAAMGDRKQARTHFQEYMATGPDAEAQLEMKQILEMLGAAGEDDDDGPIYFE